MSRSSDLALNNLEEMIREYGAVVLSVGETGRIQADVTNGPVEEGKDVWGALFFLFEEVKQHRSLVEGLISERMFADVARWLKGQP